MVGVNFDSCVHRCRIRGGPPHPPFWTALTCGYSFEFGVSPSTPPREPQGDQKGDKENSKTGYTILRNVLFNFGKATDFEARGNQKATQGPPKTKPMFEEKRRRNKKSKIVTKRNHDH